MATRLKNWGRKNGFRKISAGSQLNNIHVHMCNGCGKHYRGKKPPQCEVCGRMDFHSVQSAGEAARVSTLILMQEKGKITELRFQVPFPLYAAKPTTSGQCVPIEVGRYVADACYKRDGKSVIEEMKPGGIMTDLADWKLRHMRAQGYEILITR